MSDFVLGSYVPSSKPKTKSDTWHSLGHIKELAKLGSDGVRLCSWFLRAVFETKNKV